MYPTGFMNISIGKLHIHIPVDDNPSRPSDYGIKNYLPRMDLPNNGHHRVSDNKPKTDDKPSTPQWKNKVVEYILGDHDPDPDPDHTKKSTSKVIYHPTKVVSSTVVGGRQEE